ncbi:hypothetical protein A6E15_17970 [Natrinema saccharevitans]|uniref:Uncharacterized protein n=1 Tax=Natrinema saccharevitans TaxID=301967 RepID=A0A1S8ARB7_9EURY|nr:hypothetical protein [Natrinema saccharevitans]OLZ39285.1 hypothetical protein A6E15_17970 [Natrinema saccharevitans]
MQRRQVLLGATAVVSGFTGCIGSFTSAGSLREVNVELRNADDRARTFHLTLETEAGVLDWESHHIDADVDKRVTMTPNEEVSPVALHGAVEDFAGSVDILGVDDLDEDYCLRFHFWSAHPSDERPQMGQVADIEC